MVAPVDRMDMPMPEAIASSVAPSRRNLLHLLEGRSATDLDSSVLAALASLDGATVVDRTGRLLAAGAILRHPPVEATSQEGIIEGARTTAAMAAGKLGPVLKVSEDGDITFYDRERVWDI
jgi:DNA integrity scanning protein DisA with diadenylate cyclase activity